MDYGEMIKRLKEKFDVGAFPGKNPNENEIPDRSPFEVLISTVLSQRTKDVNTHKASQALFSAILLLKHWPRRLSTTSRN